MCCLSLLLLLSAALAEEPLGTVIGIDLGTTYSCVAVYKNGRVEILANEQGHRVTPSWVGFTDGGERLVGDGAKAQASLNPAGTLYDAKRLIGRSFADEAIQADIPFWPFKVTADSRGKPLLQLEVAGKKRALTPQEVSAMVLGKMRETAEAFLGEQVHNAVITVPAYFNDAQRQATKDAGAIAGLNVLRILNEPTAAALAYGFDRSLESATILVFDLGGGTFDVSLLAIDSGVFEVLSTAGDTHLGGEDLDNRLIEHLLTLFNRKNPSINLGAYPAAMHKLRREAERAKRQLSSQTAVNIEIESIRPGVDFSETVTRAKFEDLCADLFRKTMLPVERVLEDAGISRNEVDEVVLVGGSTRIPKIRDLLTNFFNGKPPNTSINPDEAVAYGAAVQAGVLSGERDKKTMDLLLLDVTPLTLGIETTGGVMDVLVPRNTVVPAKASKLYTNAEDGQLAVNNMVFEGERKLTRDNRLLGQFELSGWAPMPKGQAQIEVTFDIDVNGILSVSALEKTSGQRAMITIKNSDRLADEIIARMIKEAEEYRREDERAIARVRARAALEDYIYAVRKQLKDTELRERMLEEDADKVLRELERADQWLDDDEDTSAAALEDELIRLRNEAVEPILRQYRKGGVKAGSEASVEDLYEFEHGEL